MLKYARVVLRCRWEEPGRRIRSPLHWRDDLEGAVRRVACILPRQDCNACIVRARCTYAGLFLSDTAHEDMGPKGQDPLPFAFLFPEPGEEDRDFRVELTLTDPWVQRLPYWLFALERMGKDKRHPFRVVSGEEWADGLWLRFYDGESGGLVRTVEARGPHAVFVGDRLEFRWLRPGRLFRGGRPAVPLDFQGLVAAILRRVAALCRRYGEGETVLDRHKVMEEARGVRLIPMGLRWEERHLYSRKQGQSVAVGGLVGGMLLEGPLEPFCELLALGRDLGVGKGTALGLGRYDLGMSSPKTTQ